MSNQNSNITRDALMLLGICKCCSNGNRHHCKKPEHKPPCPPPPCPPPHINRPLPPVPHIDYSDWRFCR